MASSRRFVAVGANGSTFTLNAGANGMVSDKEGNLLGGGGYTIINETTGPIFYKPGPGVDRPAHQGGRPNYTGDLQPMDYFNGLDPTKLASFPKQVVAQDIGIGVFDAIMHLGSVNNLLRGGANANRHQDFVHMGDFLPRRVPIAVAGNGLTIENKLEATALLAPHDLIDLAQAYVRMRDETFVQLRVIEGEETYFGVDNLIAKNGLLGFVMEFTKKDTEIGEARADIVYGDNTINVSLSTIKANLFVANVMKGTLISQSWDLVGDPNDLSGNLMSELSIVESDADSDEYMFGTPVLAGVSAGGITDDPVASIMVQNVSVRIKPIYATQDVVAGMLAALIKDTTLE